MIGLLLISVLFLTACQQAVVDTPSTPTGNEADTPTNLESAEDIDLVAEDEVDIGELI